jgi:DNA polymerase-1
MATIQSFTEQYDFFKKLDKQASNYLLGLIERAENDLEGRIYTQLFLHTTSTGRLSSRNPNLQNITRTKEGLPDIRGLFRASPGRKIVNVDYSQAELRSIAAFSGDAELSRAYREGIDLHSLAAERFYGKGFSKEQRQRAKNMNFGVAFLQGPDTFQEKHEIPKEEAAKFIAWWWQTFTGVAAWEESVKDEIKTKGVLASPFGRKRRFHLLTRENLQESFRQGINFYPQSTASDLTLTSGMRVANEVDEQRAGIILLVHDSIVADVEEDYVDEYTKIAMQVMADQPSTALGWSIPFTADASVGDTWGSAA